MKNIILLFFIFVGVQCLPCEEPPFFKCGSCPTGFTGNGTNCVDLDEVRYFNDKMLNQCFYVQVSEVSGLGNF
jgi:hypothetical protein